MRLTYLTVVLLLFAPLTAHAAEGVRTKAVRRTAAISVDGRMDDPGWSRAPVADGFIQRFPTEGAKATHKTEFRIAYDDKAVYVGVRCYHDKPDEIRGLLTRRDQVSSSDWVLIGLDSYHDRRTAYFFAVNAAGVQRDFLIFNDGEQDDSWDAVWSAAANVDEQGWVVEMRIPLSQLRYSTAEKQNWGIQLIRREANGEETTWSPWPRTGPVVSVFGELDDIEGLRPGRRAEFLPYLSGGMQLAEDDPANPFDASLSGLYNAGVDVKYGLSSAFTVAATLNPDFGQVEADPSLVNLTGQQSFFPEKRPFFLEGRELFRYSLTQGDDPSQQGEGLFYSRRIGNPPHLHGDDYAPYSDTPSATVIYGAAKVSGKTSGGWSVGALEAVTGQEKATLSDDLGELIVEPLTNYAMLRTLKDLRHGRTTVAAAVTAVNRKLDGTEVKALLHDQAYTGGVDVSHRFHHDEWATNWKLFGSYVHGSKDAIYEDQTDIVRLYQRPDRRGGRLLDPDRTSLSGYGLQWDFGRWNNKHLNFGTGGDYRSPGVEVNDMGFSNRADQIIQWGWLGYRVNEPTAQVLNWGTNLNTWAWSNFEPELGGYGGNVNLNATLESYWSFGGGIGAERGLWNNQALRGGPRLHAEDNWQTWFNLGSDSRKKLFGNFNVFLFRRPESDSWQTGVNGAITVQARSNLDLSLGPDVQVVWEDHQYIDTVPDAMDETSYVFARMHEIVTALTVRAAYTFSPNLSVQLYAQPFIAAGKFDEYKEAANTYSGNYDDRFAEFQGTNTDLVDEAVFLDRDGDGVEDVVVGIPDFDVREVRSNLVVRWEYRPGSTAYLIWAHNASSDELTGDFRFGHDLAELGKERGSDVVMVKVNYWFGL